MAFCTKCGTQNPDGAQFCAACGQPMAQQTPPQQTYTPPQQAYTPPQQAYTPPQQPYAAPQSAYTAPVGMRTPVKTDYSLIVCIVLSFVTCGIYGFYLIYKLSEDVNQICAEDGDKTGGLAAYILLSFLTCGIYSLYWEYKLQNRMQAAAPRYGLTVSESGTTVLLWYLIGSLLFGVGSFVALYILLSTANKVGAAYNAKYFYNR